MTDTTPEAIAGMAFKLTTLTGYKTPRYEASAMLTALSTERDQARAVLAEAVGLLREAHAWDQNSAMPAYSLGKDIAAFIAKHT